MKLRSLAPGDFDVTVWRYLPFGKFVSLLTFQAVWFSKLNILQDQFEGRLPSRAVARMREEAEKWKAVFQSEDHHQQLDAWPGKNEADGRELLVVTCWFEGDEESRRMWNEYGGSNEAVAVKSTIRRLARSIYVPRDDTVSHLGRVRYVDYATHDMTLFEANQAIERAFLKDRSQFIHENEVRLVTMNVKTVMCASPEGVPYTEEQVSGAGMNNFENPGLYVGADLNTLIAEVVVAPGAQSWFERLVRRLVAVHGLSAPVVRSSLADA